MRLCNQGSLALRKPRKSPPRRHFRLGIQMLEDRSMMSWSGAPPTTVSIPSSTFVTLNSAGDASGNASITANEADYYRFVAPASGSYHIDADTPSSNMDTVLGVFNAFGQRLAYNDDRNYPSDTDSDVTLNLTAGNTYYFGITNYSGSPGGSYQWIVNGPSVTTLTPTDDAYEQNDSFGAAYNFGTLTGLRTVTGLKLTEDSTDWFRFTMNGTGTSSDYVRINFNHSQGDVDLELYNASGALLRSSGGTSNSEQISLSGLSAGTYYIRVFGYNGARNPSYSLAIDPAAGASIGDDAYEQNDSFSAASTLGTLTARRTITGLKLVEDSTDWFRFTMNGTGTSSDYVRITFTHSQGDVDLQLYNANGSLLRSSDGVTNSEQILLNGLGAGTYYVRVFGYSGARNPSYSLEIDPAGPTSPPPPPPPPGGGGFTIQVVATGMNSTQLAAFQQAANRWAQVITGDLPNATYNGQVVDDLRIEASAVYIDGVNGVLGSAGPDAVRSGGLPYHGTMRFDTADLAAMQSNGTLLSVILHEMGHVLGIGTLWQSRGLLTGAGTSNPRFTGSQARAAYNQIFGVNESGVPVENTGGQGTRDGHFRESVLDTELMTGYAEQGSMPLSRITVGSLADLGYTVNFAAADPYSRPSIVAAFAAASSANRSGLILLQANPTLEAAAISAALPTSVRGPIAARVNEMPNAQMAASSVRTAARPMDPARAVDAAFSSESDFGEREISLPDLPKADWANLHLAALLT